MVFGSLKKIILEKKQKPQEEPILVARQFEEKKVLQILAKAQKNNCIIIGKKGVGKSTLLKNLQKKINQDIVVVDDVHLLSEDDALSLKEQIIDKKCQCVISTTYNAYKSYKDFDGFFANNFTPVLLNEPNNDDMVEILALKAAELEVYHNVIIKSDILTRLVELSQRYLYKRYLPLSAVDVLDEVCAKKAVANFEVPKDLEALLKNIEVLKNKQLNQAEKIELIAFEAKYQKLYAEWQDKKTQKAIVDIDDICAFFVEKTGYEFEQIKEKFVSKIYALEQNLKNCVIAQDEAIEKICAAIKERFITQSASLKPLSFCFLGQEGVGKYKVLKEIAKNLFDDENNVVSFINAPYQVIITDDVNFACKKMLRNNILIYKEKNDFIDEVISFKPIERKDARLIAKTQISEIFNDYKKRNISIELEEQAYMFLLNNGYNPKTGVGNMRAVINKEILSKTTKLLEENDLRDCTFYVYFQSSGLEVKVK